MGLSCKKLNGYEKSGTMHQLILNKKSFAMSWLL